MSLLTEFLNKNGRLPRVNLRIKPLDPNKKAITLTEFMSYNFSSSIMVPVDRFTFSFTNPALTGSFTDFVAEGDIAELQANGEVISTGTIDMIDIETTEEGGEVVTVIGRDLMAQLEDQSAISINDDPIYANSYSIESTVRALISSTRIRGMKLQNAPGQSNLLFSTEPGENKISALQRFLEPINCLFWSSPEGYITVGKPNFSQEPKGDVFCDRQKRNSNVQIMKATFASTQIPNIIVPIWTGQETTQSRVSREQRIYNAATGPKSLRQKGFLVPKAIVVSTPQGSTAQDLAEINFITNAGSSNLLQAHAKREMARANVSEMIVQATVKGHYNDNLEPFLPDTTYKVIYPRAKIDEKMYLYQVEYFMDEKGPRTTLNFCKLHRIVADTYVNKNVIRTIKVNA